MSSSSSSSISVPPRASVTPPTSSSSALAASASIQSLFAKHPVGSLLVAQGNPRLQAVVVGQHTTAAGSALLSLFQTGYYDRSSHEWVPPRLRDRYINRLPQQQAPPDHVFEDPAYVQQQILRMVKNEPTKEFTETDFDALINQLSAQASLPPPPPIFIDTSSDVGGSASRPFTFQPSQRPSNSPVFSQSRRHTIQSPQGPSIQAPPLREALQLNQPDLTGTVEALAKRLEDIDLFVRSQHSGSQRPNAPAVPPPPPASHHSPVPSVPGLPTVHPQLLVDASPRISSHSRSRSRSRSRDRHASVRPYTNVYVPCPFHDNRQAMTPDARAKGTASMRKLYRRILRDFFSFHPSATRAAKDILVTSRTSTYKPQTWEEAHLLNYAYLLDLFLLEANSGSWTLWSEPGIDWLVRSFLEMAVRVSPKKELPDFLDPYLAGRIRRLKYGENKKFGPVPTKANNNTRRPPFTRPNNTAGVLGATPASAASVNSQARKGPVPPTPNA